MKIKKIKFQSVKVNFPKKLYIYTSWFVTEDKKLILHPSILLYTTMHKALTAASDTFWKHKDKALNYAFIQTLEISEVLPLKKQYWDNPAVPYDTFNRVIEFLKVIDRHSEYKVMVTPANAKEKWLTAAAPFLKSASLADVEYFMMASDWNVDPRADSFAFYTISEPINVNLFTGKVTDKNRKVTKKSNKKVLN